MNNKKILIFEDHKIVLEAYLIILQDAGFTVEVSETSHDVIEKTDLFNPDIILMDNWIPDIGGVQATRLLKSEPKYRDIPVIYVSANSNIEQLAQDAGADACLAKPFDLDSLLGTIKSLITGNTN